MWGEFLASLVRWLVTPFIWMWAGANWTKRRAAEKALANDRKSDVRLESIRTADIDELDKRLRDSME